jgi:hypothetical protein
MTPVILARDTTEAIAVIRVGPIVYKLLRPPEHFAEHPNGKIRGTPAQVVDQWRCRVAESLQPPLNPTLYVESLGVMVSRFVEGRTPTNEELQTAIDLLESTGRDYCLDIAGRNDNAVATSDGVVIVEFWIDSTARSRSRLSCEDTARKIRCNMLEKKSSQHSSEASASHDPRPYFDTA